MSETRLRARQILDYPGDEQSYKRALRAVAAGKSPRSDPERYNYRHVTPGEWCDDLPERLREAWIGDGSVEVVTFALTGLSAADAIEHVKAAALEDLDALEAEESGGKARKTVLEAIAARRVTDG